MQALTQAMSNIRANGVSCVAIATDCFSEIPVFAIPRYGYAGAEMEIATLVVALRSNESLCVFAKHVA